MSRKKYYISLYLRGLTMGMADIVPGISGGTIALITGIYEELIYSIRSIDIKALRLLVHFQFSSFWKKINGGFLFPVVAGIVTSVILFAKLMNLLLDHYPILIWAFFFGLIIASIPFIIRKVQWNIKSIAMGLAGIGIAYWITVASPMNLLPTPSTIFLSGALAICAMILPGISGAFILLLLGHYKFLTQAIAHFDIAVIAIFISGSISGLVIFVRLLNWILHHHQSITLALLAGFTLGSLNKIWPWKQTLAFRLDKEGYEIPVISQNIWPTEYLHKTGHEPQLLYAILLAILGILIVIFAEGFITSLKIKH